jgi:hypothetical protein
MNTNLSKAQRIAIADTIINSIEGEEAFKTPFPDWVVQKLRNVVYNFVFDIYEDKDLDIAEIFRYLPYTHEENERLLANQLLAWYKIGALDNERLFNIISIDEVKQYLFDYLVPLYQ